MPILISVHVPKTGGTSFRRVLESHLGAGLQIDHPWVANRPEWMKTEPIALSEEQMLGALSGIRGIHGHFNAGKYQSLLDTKADPIFVTWLRHPVERAVSGYYFLRNTPEPRVPGRQPAWELKAKQLDIDDYFSSTGHWKNIQWRQLYGVDLDRFAFVGLTERYDLSLTIFQQRILPRLQGRWGRIASMFRQKAAPHERRNEQRKSGSYEISPTVRRLIEDGTPLDMALYDQAARRFPG